MSDPISSNEQVNVIEVVQLDEGGWALQLLREGDMVPWQLMRSTNRIEIRRAHEPLSATQFHVVNPEHVETVQVATSIRIDYKQIEGIHVYTSPDLPGLYVAHADKDFAHADVRPAVEKLMTLNTGNRFAVLNTGASQPPGEDAARLNWWFMNVVHVGDDDEGDDEAGSDIDYEARLCRTPDEFRKLIDAMMGGA